MKFSLSWLKTHLQTEASLQTITDTLTAIGLELESVTDRGAPLAAFRIAHVLEAVQHPNADRLRACRVDTGAGIVSVVCGAPNARTGMKAVFAPPGSVIPATGITLKTGEIRGVESAGMLLSIREMALGDDHEGIVDLPEDAPIGMPYAEYAKLDDPIIDIAVTPNRGDALSVRGIARDLAAAGLGTLLPFAPPKIPPTVKSRLGWKIDWPEACPYVLGRTIRGLTNASSPAWLQERLLSIGLRPINALVDITNFVTIDLGRPLHVFGAGKVQGDVLTFRQGAGESFRALNGRDYTARPEDCVIADQSGVQSLAGVMCGAQTGCDATTTEVFVECALFDPVRVAMTGRHHSITSDARARFERGIDPSILPDAIEAVTKLILDLCGGQPSEVVSAGQEPKWQREATLRFARLAEFGGLDVPPEEAIRDLERLGFTPTSRTDTAVTVQVPAWRNDVASPGPLDPWPDLPEPQASQAAVGRQEIEPEADLIEEVLRLRGFNAIPPVSMPVSSALPLPTLSPRQTRTALARRVIATSGYAECVTFSFMATTQAALFSPPNPSLVLDNPIAADLDAMRPTPLATLAYAAARNAARGWPDTALFEIGPAYQPTTQTLIAAGLRTGATPRIWSPKSRHVDALDAKADALAVLAALGVPMDSLTTTQEAPPHYHPGQSGTLRQGPKIILATFGALHPKLVAAIDLPPSVAFEIHLDTIAEPKRRKRPPADLPTLQPLRRDFAFIVPRDLPAESLLRAARTADRTLITNVALFDLYEDISPTQKSLGIEVTFQPRDHTLTDPEIEAATTKLIAAITKATGATLR